MDVVIFMLYMYLFFLFVEFYIFILYIEKCLSFKVEVFRLCMFLLYESLWLKILCLKI